MRYKLEKCMRIVNDLMMYCAAQGATEYHVDYIPTKAQCSFVLRAGIAELPAEAVEKLCAALAQKRTKEVEELYWAINYDSDSPCENVMLGMMLDKSSAEYIDGILTIRGTRKD